MKLTPGVKGKLLSSQCVQANNTRPSPVPPAPRAPHPYASKSLPANERRAPGAGNSERSQTLFVYAHCDETELVENWQSIPFKYLVKKRVFSVFGPSQLLLRQIGNRVNNQSSFCSAEVKQSCLSCDLSKLRGGRGTNRPFKLFIAANDYSTSEVWVSTDLPSFLYTLNK